MVQAHQDPSLTMQHVPSNPHGTECQSCTSVQSQALFHSLSAHMASLTPKREWMKLPCIQPRASIGPRVLKDDSCIISAHTLGTQETIHMRLSRELLHPHPSQVLTQFRPPSRSHDITSHANAATLAPPPSPIGASSRGRCLRHCAVNARVLSSADIDPVALSHVYIINLESLNISIVNSINMQDIFL
ncbi:uncharacterized protein LACBIDRAFT_300129 [Laccaria bicolor S238N-H82]|uniref:Predicted protein n=1 Tax=Laccaria bicolor (strain S238N-H82 / ATCC MYA-4686) TaxID=486041 RepID=B0DG32_LACBS|nr:uncharacterized protein LACBIDRAFT_300129 [Laccaria bicolor S238N-H82]EDR06571.1 predicted protein [Laccaria bicolor S238N-H82]|eukprot:XP_001882943.1 predicted protein [Laccaria bicolor S238N-H82]